MSAFPETGAALTEPAVVPSRSIGRPAISLTGLRKTFLLLAFGVALGSSLLGWKLATTPSQGPTWSSMGASQGLFAGIVPARSIRLGEGPGGHNDVHLAWVRSAPGGMLFGVWGEVNLSRSPAVDESIVATAAGRIAWSAHGESTDIGAPTVEVLILDSPTSRNDDKAGGLGQRIARSVTNLELFGQLDTAQRSSIRLRGPTKRLDLEWMAEELRISTDEGEIVLGPEARRITRGGDLAELTQPTSATPDLFRWAVDQARYSSLVGPDRLQWMEHLYLDAVDRWAGLTEGQRQAPSAETLTRHLGRPAQHRPVGDGEQSWPPPSLEAVLSPPLEGEGTWRQRDERFMTTVENGPPLLYSTFVRTESERPNSSRVFITIWDPAWLDLDWVAGTMEPRSTEGHRGTGRIPEKSLDRLVAGFNGGFQAVDGAFGMKTRRGRFLPPVAYGATVARLADGRIGMGSWPAEDVDEEKLVAYRQNLTALVEGGRTNPWSRRFWGGVPATLQDTSRTDRTGLCLTTSNHLAYFWGQRVTVAGLARAMDTASCDYGMLLDINFSNTIFETYRIARTGGLPDVDRELDPEIERQGAVPGREGFEYRVQAMAPGMTRVGFPRYIRTELRDFFFLTLRPAALAPLDPLPCANAGAVDDATGEPPRAWRCAQDGGADELELVTIDPRRTNLSLNHEDEGGEQWLTWPISTTLSEGDARIVLRRNEEGGMRILSPATIDAGQAEADDLVLAGVALDAAPDAATSGPGMIAAVGAQGSILFAWSEWPGCRALGARFGEAGFSRMVFIPAGEEQLVVAPVSSPLAVRLFEGTEPVAPRIWRRRHRDAQHRIDELGLTRHYVQIRHYLDRERRR